MWHACSRVIIPVLPRKSNMGIQIKAGVSYSPMANIVKADPVNMTTHNQKNGKETCTLDSQCGSCKIVANLSIVFNHTVTLSIRLTSVN